MMIGRDHTSIPAGGQPRRFASPEPRTPLAAGGKIRYGFINPRSEGRECSFGHGKSTSTTGC